MRIKNEEYTINGHKVVFRNAEETDSEMLINYLKTVDSESRFLRDEPEEIMLTKESEAQWINAKNNSERSFLILVYCDGTYIGNFSLNECDGIRYRHRATIGIAFYQKYTGLGIGSLALNRVIELARELKYSQLELEVFANNQRAIRLYERLGFQKYGTFPEYAHYPDGSTDGIYWMMKKP